MPNGTQNHLHTPRVRNGDPQPAPAATPEPASSRRDLTSWWRQFSKRPAKKDDEKDATLPGIFGVPLIQSIPYANVAISLFNEHGESYIYGYVPIVVAKCGVYLKEKATDVEGIFRLAGSEKRIKELKTAFDTPPRYGKGLDWTGYTVHDAANILRRYFNNLPEPIIPLQHYDPFREPLRNHQAEAVGPIEGQAPSVGGFDPDAAVRIYQHQIKALPSLNRQLLLYILDLLAVFAAKADVNKMTTSNLAAIFQPGILSHPQHDMSPQDYRLSQDVLIFLIDNQDHFLIGMEGTAVDEGTVKHIESGPSTPQARTPTTPGRNNSGIGRSASTSSSAGAESLRKYGTVRRNVSTSSKRSRHSGAVPSPLTPAFATPTSSGVHRSNTLPSQRSPALGSPRFPTGKQSGSTTPAGEEVKSPLSSETPTIAAASVANAKQDIEQPTAPLTDVVQHAPSAVEPAQHVQVQPVQTAQPVQAPSVLPAEPEQAQPKRAQTMPPQRIEMPKPYQPVEVQQTRPPAITPAIDKMPGAFPLPSPAIIPPSQPVTPNAAPVQAAQSLLNPHGSAPGTRSPLQTPTRERSEFTEAPIDSGPSVEPTPAVRTFTQILSKAAASPSSDGKEGRKPNKLQKKRMPVGANQSAQSSTNSLAQGDVENQIPLGSASPLQPPQPPFAQGHQTNSSKEGLHSYNNDTVSSRTSGTTLKPTMSPSASFRSHSTATEFSEADIPEEPPKEEKRSFWKGHKRGDSKATPTSQTDVHGSVPGGDKSMSSFASSSGWTGGGRRSLQYDSNQGPEPSTVYGSPPDTDRSEGKGTFGWFQKMRQDHKERADKRERAKSPPGSSSHLPPPQSLARPQDKSHSRGRSMEVPRSTDNTQSSGEGSKDVTPTGSSPNPPSAAVVPAPTPSSTAPSVQDLPASPRASNSYLPAALTEPKSVARSPERGSVGQPQSASTATAPQSLQGGPTLSPGHHASNSTNTITPSQAPTTAAHANPTPAGETPSRPSADPSS
ncbi:GTPase activating protein (GAP) for Rho1p [Neocucurbitaria cava]|uniref:GTPase activating protein (GAP) for Rho1p n=1 Tax=Neocucurbitaria cava TaxID=798079 RepID=A0A9W8XY22_9PLEO|nr:GTPase activating protein (GAP) for Rho1p [Neocucurbitaria cava]